MSRFLSLVSRAPRVFNNSPQCQQKLLTTTSFLRSKTVATFEEVKSVQNCPNKALLIDVREPSELQETGVIPGSINIPLAEVELILKSTSPREFEKKYGRPKPESSTPIIFTCTAGVRSANAQKAAAKLGFKDTRNYLGGWLDWEEKNKAK